MAQSIRSYPKNLQSEVVARRLAYGAQEKFDAQMAGRKPKLGLGYHAAIAARNHGL